MSAAPKSPGFFTRLGQSIDYVFPKKHSAVVVSGGSKGSNFLNASTGSRDRSTFQGKPKDLSIDLNPKVRESLVENARGVERNIGQMAALKQDFRLYSVGHNGFRQKPRSADPAWNKLARDYFEDWSLCCTVCGRFSLVEVCLMMAGIVPTDGECFIIKTFDEFGEPAIQLIETHNLSTRTAKKENVIDGIKRDPRTKTPIEYYFLDDDGKEYPVKAAAVLHVFDPERPSAVRAAPQNQHSIDQVIDAHEILAAETKIIKTGQDVARVLKSDEEGKVLGKEFTIDPGDFSAGGATEPAEETPSVADQIKAARGEKTIQIGKDDELNMMELNRPNAQFLDLIRTLQRGASQGNLPFEFSYDPNGVNGGALRLVVSKADRIFTGNSMVIIRRAMQGIWFFVIGHAIDEGRLEAPEKWYHCAHILPKRLTVDFGRDALQNRLDMDGGYKNSDLDYEERGLDPDEQDEIRAERAEKVMKICEERGIPLWMMRKPTGMSISETLLTGKPNQETDE